MIIQLLKRIGYQTADDALNFVMCGLAILPPLFMLTGFMVAGALALPCLLLLAAMVGILMPPPPAPSNTEAERVENKPRP